MMGRVNLGVFTVDRITAHPDVNSTRVLINSFVLLCCGRRMTSRVPAHACAEQRDEDAGVFLSCFSRVNV